MAGWLKHLKQQGFPDAGRSVLTQTVAVAMVHAMIR
jgi:hypothetical protein